ncbi:HIRAN domain-containing protein [Leptolyngbya sp. AN02str]|uniref:HIRAN domain-containing protein n=1 Tax=Leptolyngbya sp. AN02str TaxID=3423363 RepID=UPI003D3146E2
MKTLFLAWQDPTSRTWFPVGKLTHEGGLYQFSYLQGALEAREKSNFQPLWAFPEFYHTYSSVELFPLFANRLLRPSRPDYQDFVQWLNIPEQQDDPIALLARSGGRRKTDSFEVFPCPERDEQGNYHIHFFAHGLRYFPEAIQQYVQFLQPGTPLLVTHDLQNRFDSRALVLRTEDLHFVGYCPRYLTQDFFELICQFPQQVNVTVERVNPPPTPIQFRLLCSLTAAWSEGFQPFSSPIYQPLTKDEFGAIA